MSAPVDALNFPLPGDAIKGRTVIASVEYFDDERGAMALLLLLRSEPKYYEVAHYALTDIEDAAAEGDTGGCSYEQGDIDTLGTYWHIVNAAKAYEEYGGEPAGDS